MAYYTAGMKSTLIDPVIDIDNNRVEWRLQPNALYSSDIKLMNFGVFQRADAHTDRNHLNTLGGAWGNIKNIYLTDNGTTLDQVLDANYFMAFKKYNTPYAKARNIDRTTTGNNVGQVCDKTQLFSAGVGLTSTRTLAQVVGDTSATSQQSFLSLRDVLPILRNMEYIPTSLFTDLKIVIEYEGDIKKVLALVQDAGTSVKISNLPNPLLRVDEITNMEAVKELTRSFRGVAFNCYERDVQGLPHIEATAGASKANSHSALIKGFDNKYINRLWCGLYTSSTLALELGQLDTGELSFGGSLAPVRAIDSRWQVVVNGANKLVGNGVQKSNEVLGLLVDTFGEMATPIGGASVGLYSNADMVSTDDMYSFAKTGFFGVPIQEYISQLQVNVDWTTSFNEDVSDEYRTLAKFNTPYTLYCWAECKKSLSVVGGRYEIGYS